MLTKGDRAPDFELMNQAEDLINLKNFKGKWLVLYFYPRDNTSGCTLEAKDFTCLVDQFKELGVEVVGVSKDSAKSHQNFISKHDLGIELLVDADHKTMEEYGVWQLKKMYGKESMGVVRSTFLIDPKSMIAETWYKIRAKGHAENVLQILKEKL
ncbi:peroxiredoxin [Candidatus Cloacimonadota bacterium]